MSSELLAWHFVGRKLRNGQPVPEDGEVLRHDGELVMCNEGLHASVRAVDALSYAPGAIACRVKCGGVIVHDDDKLVCSERTILWRVDAEEMLRDFARQCALDVVGLWETPEVVVRYLKTGDESLRDAAMAASGPDGTAASTATGTVAWVAAWVAAWAAASATARDAASTAAWAAKEAVRAATIAAMWAARNTECDAARAARVAAKDAARETQENRLVQMITERHELQTERAN